jgi:uncharacterized protein (TIGR02598 family)
MKTHPSVSRRGFSLVEVAVALGLMSFVIVGLLGLIPIGLNTIGDAKNDSLRAEIIKSVANTAQQTDFSLLGTLDGTKYQFDNYGMLSSTGAIYEAVLKIGPVSVPSSTSPVTLPGLASVTIAIHRITNTKSEASTHVVFISDNGR